MRLFADELGVWAASVRGRWPNKDSLLATLIHQHHAELHRVLSVAFGRFDDPSIPLEHALRTLFTDLLALHQINPDLTRALSPAVLDHSPAAEEMHSHGDDHLGRRLVDILPRHPEVRAGDHPAMAAVLSQTARHLTRWLVHDAPPNLDQTTLLEEVIQLQLRYLR